MNIFNIHIEFEPDKFRAIVEEHIRSHRKDYVCVVDGSVISRVQNDLQYREIVNGATVNTCDGSSITMLANRIYGTHYHAYNGPEVFEHYIERPYRHLLVGNTQAKVDQIKSIVRGKGIDIDLTHLDVPFVSVEQFDYPTIARQINELHPDIIWVSLGNPKQEIFMSRILPLIDSGVMFGIGAAFNFYTGDLHNRKKEYGGLRLIWLERILKEPRKMRSRFVNTLKTYPKMYFAERRKARKLGNYKARK